MPMLSRRSLLTASASSAAFAGARASLQVAVFHADITPPAGTPLCLGLVPAVATVADPLQARGLVLLPSGQPPIVLCALDWLGVGNTSQDRWKSALARAAGTAPSRVVVHTVHQHDAPGEDMAAAGILGVDGVFQSTAFARMALDRVTAAVKRAKPRRISHVSAGEARVEQVASNRRILGPDGKVAFVRYTACRGDARCGEPEGVIDPMMKSIGFWDGERDERVATLHYYATHPMSHYGKGAVSADFPGIARAAQTDGFTVYFTGAAGNIGAGKYNNGSPEARVALGQRMADGMRRARAAERKHAVDTVGWSIVPVRLPHRGGSEFSEAAIAKALADTSTEAKFRANAARYMAWHRLAKAGREIPLSCLHLGPASVLHLPGELFIEYQLAAQKETPKTPVAMAAYGDYGPMYIGTAKAYGEGGYETSAVSRVAPETEEIVLAAQRKALLAR